MSQFFISKQLMRFLQLLNVPLIDFNFLVFHFYSPFNIIRLSHLLNVRSSFSTFLTSQFAIPSKFYSLRFLAKQLDISFTCDTSQFLRSSKFSKRHSSNVPSSYLNLLVSKSLSDYKSLKLLQLANT